jgi:synaptic vesicle membrane protein VAT-1
MRQIVTTGSGGVNVLKILERPAPSPLEGEVLISVKASGLNFADIMARQGLYPDAPKKPCVLGYEVSGIVEAVGKGVDPTTEGRSVIALTHFGGQSEMVSVPQSTIFPMPKSMTYEEAAAIPVNYLTAYALLVVMGSLQKGQSLVIHNAGSGMGLAALDIAKHIGAETFGTASGFKHAFLKERGLDHAIDYREQDWFPVLMQMTNGRGVDLIIDPIGGSNWMKSYHALSPTGRLGAFGVSTISAVGLRGKLRAISLLIRSPRFTPIGLFNDNKGVFGVNMGHLWNESEKLRKWMEVILNGVEEGWVRPHVDRTFAFAEVSQAHLYIESRKNIGKVVLTP